MQKTHSLYVINYTLPFCRRRLLLSKDFKILNKNEAFADCGVQKRSGA